MSTVRYGATVATSITCPKRAKHESEEDIRIAQKKQIRKVVEFSKRIGADCVTFHPGKAPIYHSADGRKLFNEDFYPRHYTRLFTDSIEFLETLSRQELAICIENTDYFFAGYQDVLSQHLKNRRIYLCWDIMKGFSYESGDLRPDQWRFLRAHLMHVRNLHISGPAHGALDDTDKIGEVLRLFIDTETPLVIEIDPIEYALDAREQIVRLCHRLNQAHTNRTCGGRRLVN